MQRGENIPLHTFCECSAIARRTRGRPPQSAHQSLGALATCPILPTWGHLGRFVFRTSLKQPPTSCTRGTTHTPTLAHHTVAGGLLCLCVLIVVPTSKLPPPESWDPPGLCRLTVASLRLSLARAKWCPPMRRFSPGSVRAFGSSALQVQTLASRCEGSLPGLRTFASPARSFVLRTLAPQRAFALRSFGLRTFPPPCYELSDSEPSHRSATSLRIPNLPSHCRLSDGHPAPC